MKNKLYNNIYIIYICISALLLFSAPLELRAQETGKTVDLSLGNAVETALKHNFQVQIAKQETNISNNNNTWGNAGRYPTLDAGVDLLNNHNNSPSPANNGQRVSDSSSNLSASVEMRWMLFQGFKIKIRKNQLDLLNQKTKGQATSIMQETVKQVTMAYYRMLLEQEKLAVMEQVRELSHDRYQKELERKKYGSATTYQVLRFKTAWLEDQSRVLTQKAVTGSAERELNRLMGNSQTIQYRLTGSFSVEPSDYQYLHLRSQLLQNNQDLKNLRFQQAVLKKDIALQKSAYYPAISLNSGVRRMTAEGIGGPAAYDYYANIGIQYNLFNGNNTKRAVANASISHKIAQLQLKKTTIQLENQLKDTFETYNARKQVFQVTIEQQKTAALSLDLSKEKLNTGAIDSFNYRDIQLTYLNAALEKLQATYNLIDSITSIKRLTGGFLDLH